MLVITQPAGGDRKLTRPTRAHSKMATEFFMFEGFFFGFGLRRVKSKDMLALHRIAQKELMSDC